MTGADLKTDVSSHFEFGENWAAFARQISDTHIAEAKKGVSKLVDSGTINGARVLDIGCGSGIHALAFVHLGAGSVTAMDFDPASVATTQATLEAHAPDAETCSFVGNILEPSTLPDEQYDIVYSWGVLHHTGSMWQAVENAFRFTKPGGTFIIALYVRTPFCGLWQTEKRLYTRAPSWLRAPITWLYAAICWLRLLAGGRNPMRFIRDYNKNRGMSWYHDRIDWLGGYPYESTSAGEVIDFMSKRGGTLANAFNTEPRWAPLGTGCAEYTFTKAHEA